MSRRHESDGSAAAGPDPAGEPAREPKLRSMSGSTLRNAIAIVKDDGVRRVSGSDIAFKVQSQSSSAWYNVVVDEADGIRNCSCPRHRMLRKDGILNARCKHVRAAEIWLLREYGGVDVGDSGRSDNVRKHPLYNTARSKLPRGTLELIRCLTSTLTPEETLRRRHRTGRRPFSSGRVYANLLAAAASTKGSREAVDPAALAVAGLGAPQSAASRLGWMQDDRVPDGLRRLLERTGLGGNTAYNFGEDCTHFRTPHSVLTSELREGKKTVVVRAVRCKLHLAICTDTQLIVSAYVSNPYVADIAYFNRHVDDVWRLFGRIDTWHADHAYHSKETLARIARLGGDPSFIEFGVDDRANGDPIWDSALARYRQRREGEVSHRRSLVESVNNALRIQGHKVRARYEVTRECELLARCVVYNLRRLAYLHITQGLVIPFADQRAIDVLHGSGSEFDAQAA